MEADWKQQQQQQRDSSAACIDIFSMSDPFCRTNKRSARKRPTSRLECGVWEARSLA